MWKKIKVLSCLNIHKQVKCIATFLSDSYSKKNNNLKKSFLYHCMSMLANKNKTILKAAEFEKNIFTVLRKIWTIKRKEIKEKIQIHFHGTFLKFSSKIFCDLSSTYFHLFWIFFKFYSYVSKIAKYTSEEIFTHAECLE